jgi:hypothetical protein
MGETLGVRCYHFVLGLDVSSEACIAAYFGGLVAHTESPRLLSELVSRIAKGRTVRRWGILLSRCPVICFLSYTNCYQHAVYVNQ